MSEGELYKKIIRASEVGDYRGNRLTENLTRHEALKILDEAKKELTSKDNSTFLTDDAGGTTHIAIDIHIFKKWLGE